MVIPDGVEGMLLFSSLSDLRDAADWHIFSSLSKKAFKSFPVVKKRGYNTITATDTV